MFATSQDCVPSITLLQKTLFVLRKFQEVSGKRSGNGCPDRFLYSSPRFYPSFWFKQRPTCAAKESSRSSSCFGIHLMFNGRGIEVQGSVSLPPQKKWRSILPKKISERRWKQIVHLLKPPNFQKRTMLSFWHCSCQTLFAYVSWTSSSWFMVWPYRHRLPCFAQKKVGIVNVVWKTSLNTCIQYTSYKLEVCGSNEFRYSFFHRTLPNVFAKTCFVIEPK